MCGGGKNKSQKLLIPKGTLDPHKDAYIEVPLSPNRDVLFLAHSSRTSPVAPNHPFFQMDQGAVDWLHIQTPNMFSAKRIIPLPILYSEGGTEDKPKQTCPPYQPVNDKEQREGLKKDIEDLDRARRKLAKTIACLTPSTESCPNISTTTLPCGCSITSTTPKKTSTKVFNADS